MAEMVLGTVLKIGVALAVLAGLDYAYQRLRHERDLRMSRRSCEPRCETCKAIRKQQVGAAGCGGNWGETIHSRRFKRRAWSSATRQGRS